ncbi:MAG: hypothetical protein ABEI07_00465 [Candidatus Nanohaloarchaea archaeon]
MVSPIVAFAGGFALGAVSALGGFVFYMRYRTRKQLERMEDQMGQMFDVEEGETDEFAEL